MGHAVSVPLRQDKWGREMVGIQSNLCEANGLPFSTARRLAARTYGAPRRDKFMRHTWTMLLIVALQACSKKEEPEVQIPVAVPAPEPEASYPSGGSKVSDPTYAEPAGRTVSNADD